MYAPGESGSPSTNPPPAVSRCQDTCPILDPTVRKLSRQKTKSHTKPSFLPTRCLPENSPKNFLLFGTLCTRSASVAPNQNLPPLGRRRRRRKRLRKKRARRGTREQICSKKISRLILFKSTWIWTNVSPDSSLRFGSRTISLCVSDPGNGNTNYKLRNSCGK